MDQKQKNDSMPDLPILDDVSRRSLAYMTVAAVVWLVLMSIRILTYHLSGDRSLDSFEDLAFSILFRSIVFAAVESCIWVLWQIIVYFSQRKGQNKDNSKPNSPFLDLSAIVCSGCLLGPSVVLLVFGLTGVFDFYLGLFNTGRGFSDWIPEFASGHPFVGLLTIIPLLVLLRLFYPRNKKKGQNVNHSESASLLDLLFSFAIAVGLCFLIFLWFLIIYCARL